MYSNGHSIALLLKYFYRRGLTQSANCMEQYSFWESDSRVSGEVQLLCYKNSNPAPLSDSIPLLPFNITFPSHVCTIQLLMCCVLSPCITC